MIERIVDYVWRSVYDGVCTFLILVILFLP